VYPFIEPTHRAPLQEEFFSGIGEPCPDCTTELSVDVTRRGGWHDVNGRWQTAVYCPKCYRIGWFYQESPSGHLLMNGQNPHELVR